MGFVFRVEGLPFGRCSLYGLYRVLGFRAWGSSGVGVRMGCLYRFYIGSLRVPYGFLVSL